MQAQNEKLQDFDPMLIPQEAAGILGVCVRSVPRVPAPFWTRGGRR
jgi:hypothetical protein